MRYFLLTTLLLAASVTAFSQVRFDAGFESGNLGKVVLLDSTKVIVSPRDTVEHLSYLIHGKFDPPNPIDTSLAANANWYYFRISGIRGKQIYLTLRDNGVHGLSYSYDGDNWNHFPLNESPRRRLDKRFDKDTVFIALYRPYTYSYLQERIAEWGKRKGTQIDTIGWSFEKRPLQLLHITDPNVPASEKKRLWIHGRQHPSETPGSWLLDAFIEKLTSDTPEARSLRA
ncbi:MAG TPA: M14 family zinc carboxypeptidase, partial [Bacteroidales bacterium]|nr:M14 family zinc carboxypeptidase [Bacteroidales bacterium]